MKHANRKVVPKGQVQRAKTMRAKMTESERKLWRALRERLPIEGSHFRRQVPIGPYIVDFCCLSARLVIEVDGNQHGTDETLAFDTKRTALIESHGFRVLRFSNFEVQRAFDSVLDTIFEAVARTPTPAPPHKGEGGALAAASAFPAIDTPPPCVEGNGMGVADEGRGSRREHRAS